MFVFSVEVLNKMLNNNINGNMFHDIFNMWYTLKSSLRYNWHICEPFAYEFGDRKGESLSSIFILMTHGGLSQLGKGN